jgi:hypothetical protein
MKIAVPEIRIGLSALSAATNSRSGIASRARFSASSRRPRHHVAMTAKTSAATTIGNQPPSAIFKKFGAEKCQIDEGEDSKCRPGEGEAPALAAHMRKASPVVIAIMPLTAIP